MTDEDRELLNYGSVLGNPPLPKPYISSEKSILQSPDISIQSLTEQRLVYFLRPSARHLDEQYFAL